MTETLPIIVLGLLLGMRHATDPDHVIAVTTIVSRLATAWRAALIGTLWEIGHTITIMLGRGDHPLRPGDPASCRAGRSRILAAETAAAIKLS